MRGIVSYRKNVFFAKVCHRVEPIVIFLQKYSSYSHILEASGSKKIALVKSGSFKTGEEHNTNLSCSKHYLYYYVHYHYLTVLSESVKGTAIVAKLGINLL